MIPDPRPEALPEYDDLTAAERDDHRSVCRDGCGFCDGYRAWGWCPECGDDSEADIDGRCLWCRRGIDLRTEAQRLGADL